MSSFESVNQWVVRTHRRLAGHADQYPEHERLQVVALTYLGLFAGLSHFWLIFLYQASGTPAIANAQYVSVAAWIVAYALIVKGHIHAAALLGFAEVTGNAFVVTYFVGVGTLIYLPVMTLPGIVFLQPRRLRRKTPLLLILAPLSVIGMHYLARIHPPEYVLAPWVQDMWILHNVILAATISMLTVLLFSTMTERAMKEAHFQRDRADELLMNVLPRRIADRLKGGERTIADGINQASVVFVDIAGFTVLSAKLSPHQLVDLLNALFSRFDARLEEFGMEKIKTIGDAYMAASGVLDPTPDHAVQTVRFALAVLDDVEVLNRERGTQLQVRVGIDSGPLVAAVIGTSKFIYDLWGDTVNTASRMESHGSIGRIQITEATYRLVRQDMECEALGTVPVKGKGEIPVWLIKARRPALAGGTTPG